MHRDLKVNIFYISKPENLMLDDKNHLKLIDFGTALIMNNKVIPLEFLNNLNKYKKKEQAQTEEQILEDYQRIHKATFVGTAEYVSPEIINN